MGSGRVSEKAEPREVAVAVALESPAGTEQPIALTHREVGPPTAATEERKW